MPDSTILPNDLSSFWMPFTANRSFKKNPRLLASADERLETLDKYFDNKDTLNEGPTYTTTTT